MGALGVFTFQYVSIKTVMLSALRHTISYLHSNMFLLRLSHWVCFDCGGTNLHSNMFLLRLTSIISPTAPQLIFTFQYVSIKTCRARPAPY